MLENQQTETAAPKPIPQDTEVIAAQVVDAAIMVHRELGPGLLESVYEICMAHELQSRDLKVERQVTLPVVYSGIRLDAGLRIDLVVQDRVVVELKAVETILPVHKAQVLTYLKQTGHRLGLLLNFNVTLMKNGIKRMVL